MMSEEDVGALPVAENDRLVGMITDRDIAIRAVGEGKGPEAKVRQVMTDRVRYCFGDEDLDQVAKNMANIQMRRLPVMNRDKRLVGIVSLGDLATAKGAVKPAQHCTAYPSRPTECFVAFCGPQRRLGIGASGRPTRSPGPSTGG